MEGRDYLDDMLYRAMPRLDQAMQECLVREQENTPLFRTSGRFERNMRRLLQKAGQRDVRNREGTRLNGAGRALPGRTRTAGRTGLSGRRLLAAVIFILAMLALGLTAGAAILRRIELIHYRDEVQGADVYRFSGDKAEGAGEAMIIYPSYIPDGYAETGNDYQGSPYYELEMEWTGPEGDTIRYTMFQTMEGGRSIYLDADYDSEEQVMVNGNAWFCTYREGAYRMARLQKGDLFFLVSTEDTFPREELIKILEGIQLPEQTEAEVAAETEDSEELHARIGELERQAEEWAMEDRPFLLEGGSEDSPENEAGGQENFRGRSAGCRLWGEGAGHLPQGSGAGFYQAAVSGLSGQYRADGGRDPAEQLSAGRIWGFSDTSSGGRPDRGSEIFLDGEACGGNYGIRLCGSAHAGGSSDPGKFGGSGETVKRRRITVRFGILRSRTI